MCDSASRILDMPQPYRHGFRGIKVRSRLIDGGGRIDEQT
jgi:hypothetical protein